MLNLLWDPTSFWSSQSTHRRNPQDFPDTSIIVKETLMITSVSSIHQNIFANMWLPIPCIDSLMKCIWIDLNHNMNKKLLLLTTLLFISSFCKTTDKNSNVRLVICNAIWKVIVKAPSHKSYNFSGKEKFWTSSWLFVIDQVLLPQITHSCEVEHYVFFLSVLNMID